MTDSLSPGSAADRTPNKGDASSPEFEIDWDALDQQDGDEVGVPQPSPAPAAQPKDDEPEEYEFPVLSTMLATYFGTGKELLFLERYEKFGEGTAEFAGLQDDLRLAIRSPKRAAREVNAVLGTELDPQTMRGQLVELLDQITASGAWSPEVIEEAEAEERDARPDPEDVLAYYFTRKVSLPASLGKAARFKIPLWGLLFGGFVLLGLGIAVGSLPLPSWLAWVSLVPLVVGLLTVAFTAVAMLGLRTEIRNPEREEARRKAREEMEEKRAEKASKRNRLWF